MPDWSWFFQELIDILPFLFVPTWIISTTYLIRRRIQNRQKDQPPAPMREEPIYPIAARDSAIAVGQGFMLTVVVMLAVVGVLFLAFAYNQTR